jgi:hypothetical protein
MSRHQTDAADGSNDDGGRLVAGQGETLPPENQDLEPRICNSPDAAIPEIRCGTTHPGDHPVACSAPAVGLEPTTNRLTAGCSTN